MPFLYSHFPLRIRTFSATFPKVCGQSAFSGSLDRTECCQRSGVQDRMVGLRAFTLRALNKFKEAIIGVNGSMLGRQDSSLCGRKY